MKMIQARYRKIMETPTAPAVVDSVMFLIRSIMVWKMNSMATSGNFDEQVFFSPETALLSRPVVDRR